MAKILTDREKNILSFGIADWEKWYERAATENPERIPVAIRYYAPYYDDAVARGALKSAKERQQEEEAKVAKPSKSPDEQFDDKVLAALERLVDAGKITLNIRKP